MTRREETAELRRLTLSLETGLRGYLADLDALERAAYRWRQPTLDE